MTQCDHAAPTDLAFVAAATGRALRVSRTTKAAPTPDATDDCGTGWTRGAVDAAAFWTRYSNAALHARLRLTTPEAALVQDALEQVRCEALGMRRYPGCRLNLAVRYAALKMEAATASEDKPEWSRTRIARDLAMLLRHQIGADDKPVSIELQALHRAVTHHLNRMAAQLGDQLNFSLSARALLGQLGLVGAPDCTATPASAARDQKASEPAVTPAQDTAEAAPATSDSEMPPELLVPGGTSPFAARIRRPTPESFTGYHIYTTQFDEVLSARRLGSSKQLSPMRERLDAYLAQQGTSWSQLARGLQRRVLARRTSSWRFDLEEGQLDAARLARCVIDPSTTPVFKQEVPSAFRSTVVGLLVDCSGSMRGEPIALAAASADVLTRALERCGVKTEVLGFTTTDWRGGPARRQWVADGKPTAPGRLAGLRHIIFKSASRPWRHARLQIAAMLRNDLLRENIDGEALLWAAHRLSVRPEQRRLLIVLSDGAPAEDATTPVNPPGYLSAHLQAVVRHIETRGAVELLAVGIGYNVEHTYQRSVTIRHADSLGPALVDQLTLLLDPPALRGSASRHARLSR